MVPTLIKDFDFTMKAIPCEEAVSTKVGPDLLALDYLELFEAIPIAWHWASFDHGFHQFSENVGMGSALSAQSAQSALAATLLL